MDYAAFFIIGFLVGISFVLNSADVLLLKSNADGSLWIEHKAKKYDLTEHKGK